MNKLRMKWPRIKRPQLKLRLLKAETQSILRSLEAEYRRPTIEQQAHIDQPNKLRLSLGEDEEKNPLCVFEAIQVAHEHGVELPAWVREYLYDFAMSMLEVTPEGVHEQVRRALGFRDYSQLHDRERLEQMESYAAAYVKKASDSDFKLSLERAQLQTAKEFKRTIGKRKGISARRGKDWCARVSLIRQHETGGQET